MTIEELKQNRWIYIQVIVGSQSFGLATDKSDVDRKGVYILPNDERMKYEPIYEVSDEKHNNVYWDISKFLDLLNNANPGALEVLYSPAHCIEEGAHILEMIRYEHKFITAKCYESFTQYARKQIAKARGLNKKVFNPMTRKPLVMDFCYVLTKPNHYEGAIQLREWLWVNKYCSDQKWFSLAAIDHMDGMYALYYQKHRGVSKMSKPEHEWRWAYGIVRNDETSDDIQLNSIPKGNMPVAFMYFNHNAFSKARKEYSEYLRWEEERNPERYAETIKHGQGYDAKNMMHCIRLLMTAIDIAEKKTVVVDRSAERDYLLSIKRGEHSFEEVMSRGDELCAKAEAAFAKADLPQYEFDSRDALGNYLVTMIRRIKLQAFLNRPKEPIEYGDPDEGK